MVNDKAAATYGAGNPHVLYVVMCGITHVQLGEFCTEDIAVMVALDHDQVHHCSPWVQYPLEHAHREDDG